MQEDIIALGLEAFQQIQKELALQPEPNTRMIRVPTLQHVLQDLIPLPPNSMFLGVCEDGLPLMLELSDPTPGAVLISGDYMPANRYALHALLASLYALNNPDDLHLHWVTTNPDAMPDVAASPHCLGILSPYERAVGDLVGSLAEIAEQRRYGRQEGAAQVLILDNLSLTLTHLEDRGRATLKWLLQNGPESQIWVVATLEAAQVSELGSRWLQLFPTRMVSRMENPKLSRFLLGQEADLSELIPGEQAVVRSGAHVLDVWLPRVDDTVILNWYPDDEMEVDSWT